MYRLIALFGCVLSLTFLITSSSAQSIFGFGSNKNENTPAAPAAPAANNNTVKVLSPDDFKKNVNVLDQQTQNALKDQLKQQISNRPPIPTQEPVTPPSSSGPLMGPANNPPTPTSSLTTQPPPLPVAPSPPTQATPSSRPTPQTSITNTPTQQGGQIYTGFPTQEKNGNNNPSPQNQQSGGWNIKY